MNWWCCRSAKRLRTFMFFNAHFASEKTLVFQSYFNLSAVWLCWVSCCFLHSYPIPVVKFFSTACLNTSFWRYVDVLILAFAHWRSHLRMHGRNWAPSVFDLAPRRHLEYMLLNDIYNSKLSLTSTFSLMKTSVLKLKGCRIPILQGLLRRKTNWAKTLS